jgi:hypothetical protein
VTYLHGNRLYLTIAAAIQRLRGTQPDLARRVARFVNLLRQR